MIPKCVKFEAWAKFGKGTGSLKTLKSNVNISTDIEKKINHQPNLKKNWICLSNLFSKFAAISKSLLTMTYWLPRFSTWELRKMILSILKVARGKVRK